jgi:hypothetical protein
LKYYKIIAWDQNTRLDPKNKPDFYRSLQRSSPFKKLFFTGALKIFLCREKVFDTSYSFTVHPVHLGLSSGILQSKSRKVLDIHLYKL